MTETFRLRIGRVRFKSGGEIRVFRNGRIDDLRGYFKTDALAIHGRRTDMAGYAIVAWGNDGSTSCALWSHNGRVVPRHLISEFVRRVVDDRLMAGPGIPSAPDDAS